MTRVGASVVTGAAIGAEAVLFTVIARLVDGISPAIGDLALMVVWSLVYSIPFALVLSFLLPLIGRTIHRNKRVDWLLTGAVLGLLLGVAGFAAVVRSPVTILLPVLINSLFGATAGVLLHFLLRSGPDHVTPVTPSRVNGP